MDNNKEICKLDQEKIKACKLVKSHFEKNKDLFEDGFFRNLKDIEMQIAYTLEDLDLLTGHEFCESSFIAGVLSERILKDLEVTACI